MKTAQAAAIARGAAAPQFLDSRACAPRGLCHWDRSSNTFALRPKVLAFVGAGGRVAARSPKVVSRTASACGVGETRWRPYGVPAR